MQINDLLFELAQALLVAVWLLSEVNCQNVRCALVNNNGTCDTGLVSQRDAITVACTLDKSALGNPTSADLRVISRNNVVISQCPVPLDLCLNFHNLDCNCVNTTNTYIVYLNKSADLSYDGARAGVTWGSDNDAVNLIVRDPASEKCTLNGQNIPDSDCTFEIKKGSSVTYSCNSALSPVKTSIFYQNISEVGDSSVVIDRLQSGEGIYTFSSKICGIDGHNGSCEAVLKEPDDEDFKWWYILLIILGLLVLGGAAAVLISYYFCREKCMGCYKETCRRDSDDGTSGNTVTNLVTNEPPIPLNSPIVVVIIIRGTASLSMLEQRLKHDLGKKGNIPNDGRYVFKYKDAKEYDKEMKLETLFNGCKGDFEVTVKVFTNGTFEIAEGVSVAVLHIPVEANESLNQLEAKVKKELVQNKHTLPEELDFMLDGKEMNDKSKKLWKLFTGLEDGMMLAVIVHLDGSQKCEIKGPENIAVLHIPVKADESLNQLEAKVKKELSREKHDTLPEELDFMLDGKEMVDKSKKLCNLFTGLKDGMMLAVIVHLDESQKCEIKGLENIGPLPNSHFRR